MERYSRFNIALIITCALIITVSVMFGSYCHRKNSLQIPKAIRRIQILQPSPTGNKVAALVLSIPVGKPWFSDLWTMNVFPSVHNSASKANNLSIDPLAGAAALAWGSDETDIRYATISEPRHTWQLWSSYLPMGARDVLLQEAEISRKEQLSILPAVITRGLSIFQAGRKVTVRTAAQNLYELTLPPAPHKSIGRMQVVELAHDGELVLSAVSAKWPDQLSRQRDLYLYKRDAPSYQLITRSASGMPVYIPERDTLLFLHGYAIGGAAKHYGGEAYLGEIHLNLIREKRRSAAPGRLMRLPALEENTYKWDPLVCRRPSLAPDHSRVAVIISRAVAGTQQPVIGIVSLSTSRLVCPTTRDGHPLIGRYAVWINNYTLAYVRAPFGSNKVPKIRSNHVSLASESIWLYSLNERIAHMLWDVDKAYS